MNRININDNQIIQIKPMCLLITIFVVFYTLYCHAENSLILNPDLPTSIEMDIAIELDTITITENIKLEPKGSIRNRIINRFSNIHYRKQDPMNEYPMNVLYYVLNGYDIVPIFVETPQHMFYNIEGENAWYSLFIETYFAKKHNYYWRYYLPIEKWHNVSCF